MGEKPRYLSRALRGADKAIRNGVNAADNAIGGAVEAGRPVVAEAGRVGDSLGRGAIDASKAGTKKIADGIEDAKRSISGGDAIGSLERLGAMWKDGLITDEEFRDAKSKLLRRL